jgi:hypothetical protein
MAAASARNSKTSALRPSFVYFLQIRAFRRRCHDNQTEDLAVLVYGGADLSRKSAQTLPDDLRKKQSLPPSG